MSKKSSGGDAELALPLALPLAGLGLNVSLADDNIAANKEPQGVGSAFFCGGGFTHYFANANSHANCRFCFFFFGGGALPITSQMQIPMQIVVSPLGHFGRSPCIRRDGGPWKHMILWLTDEVPCLPKSRSALILVCGSSWVPVLDVLHLRLTACHFFCRACLHLHRTRPALKGLSGKKNTCEEREWYSGKGRAACSRTPGRPRAACFGGLSWRPVLVGCFGDLFWRPFLVACFGGSIEVSKASPAGAEIRGKNWPGLISSPMVTWWPVLAAFFGGLFWRPVLAACFGSLFWRPILVACFGGLFWQPVLAACFGGPFWWPILVACFGGMHTCGMKRIYQRSSSLH